ncbi:MAG: hemerythrin domain-containing protein [Chloroflexi bacterium]|nr:hemerythrin domain-containing protein [Chloroflexota bacterium]
MKRDNALGRLSWDHHHGLVMARRIAQELPSADSDELAALYSDLLAFWAAGLLPHFRGEQECLLARLIRHVAPEDSAVGRTQTDHLYLEALVATMRDADDIAIRRDALERFGATLQAHIRWEEDVLFELAQQVCGPGDLAAIGHDLEEQLPPLAPAPTAHSQP